jgi:hypothetical protein
MKSKKTKNIQEFIKKENTSADFTVDEVLEFTDSNIKWLAGEYDDVGERGEDDFVLTRESLYGLVIEIKQLRDKLKEILVTKKINTDEGETMVAEKDRNYRYVVKKYTEAQVQDWSEEHKSKLIEHPQNDYLYLLTIEEKDSENEK